MIDFSDSMSTCGIEDILGRLVANLGADSFLGKFGSQCVAWSRADQVTMFLVEGGRVHCILAHWPGQNELASALCRRYLESFATRDQVLATPLMRRAPCASVIVRGDEIADSAYRDRLFTCAGLAGKIALLGTSASECLYLNFYYRDLASAAYAYGSAYIGRLGPLLVELLRKHMALGGGASPASALEQRILNNLREGLPALSVREAEICAGILCGKSEYDISQEIGLSRSTIRTFRRRAYGKLAIRRQSGLFARYAALFTT